MNEQLDPGEALKRKMSEMISKIGATFISVGKTLAERQNRLLGLEHGLRLASKSATAASAVCRLLPALQPRHFLDDLARGVKDRETLIERKLKLFPEDHRQIVDARVLLAGSDFRIEVASARSK